MTQINLDQSTVFSVTPDADSQIVLARGEDLTAESVALYLDRDSGNTAIDIAGHLESGRNFMVGWGTGEDPVGGDSVDLLIRGTGHVHSLDAANIVLRDLNATIRNNGLIETDYDATIVARSEVQSFDLVNVGTIRSNWQYGAGVIILHEDGVHGTTTVDNRGLIDGNSSGLGVIDGDLVLHNSGQILGGNSSAVYTSDRNMDGQVVNIVNTGTLEGRYTALSLQGGVGSIAEVNNQGTFAGAAYFDMATNDFTNAGMVDGAVTFAIDALDFGFRNSGTVSGEVSARGGTGAIINTGTMASVSVRYEANLQLVNTGTITGNVGQYGATGNEAMEIVNRGLIGGEVSFAHGSTYRGIGGRVEGGIDGSDFDDIFYIDQSDAVLDAGDGHDVLYMLDGLASISGVEEYIMLGAADIDLVADELNLSITGNGGRNVIVAGAGADTVSGGGGDDILRGGSGNDRLGGDAGDDQLFGNAGDDLLMGGHGDDSLRGHNGADRLFGGAGADYIDGGHGTDRMVGGAGADVFAFTFLELGATVDRVQDFTRGDDLIDLSAMASGITFIGLNGFSNTGAAEVNYRHDAHNRTWITLDIDGDGRKDGEVLLENNVVLTVDDFIL